jgi:hypothetical protein
VIEIEVSKDKGGALVNLFLLLKCFFMLGQRLFILGRHGHEALLEGAKQLLVDRIGLMLA